MVSKKTSSRIQLVVGILISLVFLYFAVRDIDPSKLGDKLSSGDYLWTLPTLLILLLVVFLLKAWRWTLILRPIGEFRVMEVFPAVMIGFMGNNIYPAHLGEFLRAHVFAKHKKLPFSTVFSTLVVERICDLISILAYFYTAVFLVDAENLPSEMRQGAMALLVITIVAIFGIIPFVLAQEKSLALSRKILSIVPEKLGGLIYGLIEKGSAGVQMARSPKLFLGCLAISFLHWLLYGLMIVISLKAFDVSITLPQALFLQGVTAVVVTVPSSPGFFGVVQWAFTTTLGLFKIDAEPVLAASFYYHLTQYIPITLVGLYYLKLLGVDVDEIRAEKNKEQPAETEDPTPEESKEKNQPDISEDGTPEKQETVS